MPVAMVMEAPGMDAAAYDAVTEKLDWKNSPFPQGFVSHYAGPTANGWMVVDVWESQADFERFAQERLLPAMEAAFGQAPDLQPRFIPIHNQDHA